MKHYVQMPQLSETVNEGVLVAWFVDKGSKVQLGDLMAEVQVEKTSSEVYAPAQGTVVELRVLPGDVIAQGAVVAEIDEAELPAAAVATRTGTVQESGDDSRRIVFASPAAKRLARELNVNLEMMRGSGPGGRIIEADVQAAASKACPSDNAHSGRVTPMRRLIGDRLRKWLNETVQVTITSDADVSELLISLAQLGNAQEKGPSLTAAVVRASALALRKHPRIAARWREEALIMPESFDIGVAVSLDDGLIVPVVRAADTKDVASLGREVVSLVERARANKLKQSEVEGGVFSISNLGAFGVDAFTPVLNPPQTAILGMGRARQTPAVINGSMGIRAVMVLSLTFDHRVIDGVPAAAFLQDVVLSLQQPLAGGLI